MGTVIETRTKAYYYNDITSFINENSDNILGALIKHSFKTSDLQRNAWIEQIEALQKKLFGATGDIIFEYDIVRLGKRIDVVLLIKHMVFSIEFKNGKKDFTIEDEQQAIDYALDIKNFHQESKDLYVCPILVATKAPKVNLNQLIDAYEDKQIYLQKENINTLYEKINKVTQKYGSEEIIDAKKRINSPYFPTPTIINAAIEAYKNHDITDIARSKAGSENIEKCEKTVADLIEISKNKNQKSVIFVTGVPGAGKTLVGLDLVASYLNKEKDSTSVYLSGNSSLVKVLRSALIKSAKQENNFNKLTEIAINGLIQRSLDFKKEYIIKKNAPCEKIVVFDEAQRVWDKQQMIKKHRDDNIRISEPHLLYQIMDRHEDWAVMICLVGLGQDINDGETGINEWFKCCIENFPNWHLYYSNEIFNQTEDKNIDKLIIKNCNNCHEVENLHLKTDLRSFKAVKFTDFIDYLLSNNKSAAKNVYNEIFNDFPIYITRNIDTAKNWAKNKVRGSQRCGVLVSSSAQRLKPYGIYVPKDLDISNWFLATSNDLRSSNMMEIVATEFDVQGLELDYTVVCWDADLRRTKDNKDWDYYNFRGTKWNHRNNENQKRYLLNTYRVLLTRARQGMIIFVPEGVENKPTNDLTRNREFYDNIYNYLCDCGIKPL